MNSVHEEILPSTVGRIPYRQLIALWKSDCGRLDEWRVSLHDGPLARLSDGRQEDMFWYSYSLNEIDGPERSPFTIRDPSFWEAHMSKMQWTHLKTGLRAKCVFPGSVVFDSDRRILLRGLYIAVRAPSWIERLVWRVSTTSPYEIQ